MPGMALSSRPPSPLVCPLEAGECPRPGLEEKVAEPPAPVLAPEEDSQDGDEGDGE